MDLSVHTLRCASCLLFGRPQHICTVSSLTMVPLFYCTLALGGSMFMIDLASADNGTCISRNHGDRTCHNQQACSACAPTRTMMIPRKAVPFLCPWSLSLRVPGQCRSLAKYFKKACMKLCIIVFYFRTGSCQARKGPKQKKGVKRPPAARARRQ